MTITSTFTNIVLHVALGTRNKNFAIYKENNEVLTSVQFTEGGIDNDLKLMDHPLESGAIITDHEVFNPQKASLTVIVDDDDVSSLAEINEYFHDGTLLTIKAKGEMYPNMVICAKPYKVSSNYFNKTVYTLSFRTVQFAETQYVKITPQQTKKAKHASTVKTGQNRPVQVL